MSSAPSIAALSQLTHALRRAAGDAMNGRPNVVATEEDHVARAYEQLLGFAARAGLETPPDPVPPPGERSPFLTALEWHLWTRKLHLWEVKAVARLSAGGDVPAAPVKPATPDSELPWAGRPEWDQLPPLVKGLLKYMYGRQTAEKDDLVEDVWRKDEVTEDALSSALHKANAFLESVKSKCHLSKVRRRPTVRWV